MNDSNQRLVTSLSIDANGDVNNGPELYKGLIDSRRPTFTRQVSMIKALDANEDNRIDLSELTAALEEEE